MRWKTSLSYLFLGSLWLIMVSRGSSSTAICHPNCYYEHLLALDRGSLQILSHFAFCPSPPICEGNADMTLYCFVADPSAQC